MDKKTKPVQEVAPEVKEAEEKALIDALSEALDGKAAKAHSHAISDVTNLQ